MKVGIDHKTHILRRWGTSFPQGEEILAAEWVIPRGHTRRGVAWSVPEALGTGLGFIGQAAGTVIGKLGETAVTDRARRRRSEQPGQAATFPDIPVVLAVTNRRYLLFTQVIDGRKHWFDPISSHHRDWIRGLDVTPGLTTHKLRLRFADDTAVSLQMTRGLGDPAALVTAIATLRGTPRA